MNYLHSDKIKELEIKAKEIHESIAGLLKDDPKSTISFFEKIDVLTLLYFHILKHNSKDPNWSERDRLIFSNRDIYPALYATLAHAGYFPIEELKTFYEFGSRSQGDPLRAFLPDVETNFTSLGSGLPRAVGMVLADKINNRRATDKFFYCFLDNGELQERQNWEAIHLAGKKQLHNLICFVDKKNIQIGDLTEETMPLELLVNKFEAVGWHVLNANGHDFDDMDDAIGQGQAVFAKPTVIMTQ